MAAKKSTRILPPSGSKNDLLIKAATLLAPVATAALKRLIDSPETQQWIHEQITRFFTTENRTPDGMLETIRALRDDVRFLAESADDAGETARAQAWAKQLDRLAQAAALLKAPGATAKQRRALKKKIGALHTDIFNAVIIEKDEDVQAAEARGH